MYEYIKGKCIRNLRETELKEKAIIKRCVLRSHFKEDTDPESSHPKNKNLVTLHLWSNLNCHLAHMVTKGLQHMEVPGYVTPEKWSERTPATRTGCFYWGGNKGNGSSPTVKQWRHGWHFHIHCKRRITSVILKWSWGNFMFGHAEPCTFMLQ